MATENDITQDETLDEDLVPRESESATAPGGGSAASRGGDSAASRGGDNPVAPEKESISNRGDKIVAPTNEAPTNGTSTNATAPTGDREARFLSEKEAEELRKVYNDPKMERLVRRLVFVGIAAVIFGLGFLFQWSRIEKECTWPGIETDEIDDGEEDILLDGKKVAKVYFPHVPGWILNREDDGNLEIYSCVGKYRNVPFRLAFSSRKLEDGFRKTMERSFDEFCATRKKSGDAIAMLAAKKDYLSLKTGHGFPVIRIDALKTVGGRIWRNHVIYFRYLDWECVLERGCPSSEYRAVPLMKETDCLVVYRAAVREHFAIPEHRMAGNMDQLLRKARAGMSRNLDIVDWRELDGTLRTLLTMAHEAQDKDVIFDAKDAWGDWRRMQEDWFARKRYAFGQAYERGDTAECNELRRICATQPVGTEDARAGRNIGEEWEEE